MSRSHGIGMNISYQPVALIVFITSSGIHLEKDMCVPFGHTVARTVCLFEI